MVQHHNKLQNCLVLYESLFFDILIGCNSALIRIRLHPDPVKIRIRPDPKIWDPVHPY